MVDVGKRSLGWFTGPGLVPPSGTNEQAVPRGSVIGFNWESRGRRPRLSSKEEKKRFRPSDPTIMDLAIACWSEGRREPYGIPTPPPAPVGARLRLVPQSCSEIGMRTDSALRSRVEELADAAIVWRTLTSTSFTSILWMTSASGQKAMPGCDLGSLRQLKSAGVP